MRDYGKVYSTFWSSVTTGGISDDAKLLALYLMTCSHSTIAGVFRLPDGYVAEDIGWDAERVNKGFNELLNKGFANRCETTKWVWVRKHLEWNKPENPNQRKAAAKVALSVPDECGWKLDFMRVSAEQLGIDWQEPANPSETVAKPFLNQKQEQKQKQNISAPSGAGELSGFAAFWKAWPTHDRKASKGKCLDAWKKAHAERDAYAIVAHVERMKQSEDWKKQGGQFIPAPLVYLNNRRWEGASEDPETSGMFAGAL